jgi:hypothetical protein
MERCLQCTLELVRPEDHFVLVSSGDSEMTSILSPKDHQNLHKRITVTVVARASIDEAFRWASYNHASGIFSRTSSPMQSSTAFQSIPISVLSLPVVSSQSTPANTNSPSVVSSQFTPADTNSLPVVSSQSPPANTNSLPVVSSQSTPANTNSLPVVSSQSTPANTNSLPVVSSQSTPANTNSPSVVSSQFTPADTNSLPVVSSQSPPANTNSLPVVSSQFTPANTNSPSVVSFDSSFFSDTSMDSLVAELQLMTLYKTGNDWFLDLDWLVEALFSCVLGNITVVARKVGFLIGPLWEKVVGQSKDILLCHGLNFDSLHTVHLDLLRGSNTFSLFQSFVVIPIIVLCHKYLNSLPWNVNLPSGRTIYYKFCNYTNGLEKRYVNVALIRYFQDLETVDLVLEPPNSTANLNLLFKSKIVHASELVGRRLPFFLSPTQSVCTDSESITSKFSEGSQFDLPDKIDDNNDDNDDDNFVLHGLVFGSDNGVDEGANAALSDDDSRMDVSDADIDEPLPVVETSTVTNEPLPVVETSTVTNEPLPVVETSTVTNALTDSDHRKNGSFSQAALTDLVVNNLSLWISVLTESFNPPLARNTDFETVLEFRENNLRLQPILDFVYQPPVGRIARNGCVTDSLDLTPLDIIKAETRAHASVLSYCAEEEMDMTCAAICNKFEAENKKAVKMPKAYSDIQNDHKLVNLVLLYLFSNIIAVLIVFLGRVLWLLWTMNFHHLEQRLLITFFNDVFLQKTVIRRKLRVIKLWQ